MKPGAATEPISALSAITLENMPRNPPATPLVLTIMRSWVILLAAAPLAVAQPFTFGIKGGVPLTDFLSATSSGNLGYFTTTNRYIVGPEAELHLPFGFGVEFNALYRHFQYSGVISAIDVLTNSSTTSGAWEFPLLAKYRFPSKVA